MTYGTKWLLDDRQTYNAFYARRTKCPDTQKAWDEVSKRSVAEQKAFVYDVVRHRAGKVPAEVFKRTKKIITERTNNDGGSWISYNAAIQEDGKDVVDEKIRAGTLQTRITTVIKNQPP